MLRPIAHCLTVLFLVSVCATPALAAEMIEGDGFKLRVPPGFRLLPAEECKTCPGGNIKLTGGLTLEGTPQMFVALAGTDIQPEAVLLVSRMNLASGSEMSSLKDMEDWVLQNMSMAQVESYEELLEEAGVQSRELKVGEFDALEFVHEGGDSLFSDDQPSTRALTVLGGDFLLVVVMMNFDGGDASTPLVWKGVVRSLHVDPPLPLLHKLGIAVVGALALLALYLFVRRVMRPTDLAARGWAEPGGVALSTEGWGDQSAVPNSVLDPAHESVMNQGELPGAMSPHAATASADSAPLPPPTSPEDKMSFDTIPPSAMPTTATPPPPRPNTPPSKPREGAGTPGGLRSPLASATPEAASRPPSGAPQPPAAPQEDKPKRSGLVRTLPSNGKWSDRQKSA